MDACEPLAPGAGAGAGAGAAAAIMPTAPWPPLWVDSILYSGALVGAAGVVASWFMASP